MTNPKSVDQTDIDIALETAQGIEDDGEPTAAECIRACARAAQAVLRGENEPLPGQLDVSAICHALTDNCVMVTDPERAPCTPENCAAMKAALKSAREPSEALSINEAFHALVRRFGLSRETVGALAQDVPTYDTLKANALKSNPQPWDKLLEDCMAMPCKYPCLRDDLGDWMRHNDLKWPDDQSGGGG